MKLDRLVSNASVVNELARTTGAGAAEARAGLKSLLPAVCRALERSATSPQGLERMLRTLVAGGFERYVDSPDLLGGPAARADGDVVLGDVLGTKEVSRRVASHASESSGLDEALSKKLLPLVACIAMGALGKRSASGAALRLPVAEAGDALGSLLREILGERSETVGTESDALDGILDFVDET